MKRASKEQQTEELKTAKVVSKAVVRAAKNWEIPNNILSEILGLSESSVSRLISGEYLLRTNKKEWQLSVLFLRAYRSLDSFMGGHFKNELAWLKANNRVLNGVPLELMQSVEGLANVVRYVDCIRGR